MLTRFYEIFMKMAAILGEAAAFIQTIEGVYNCFVSNEYQAHTSTLLQVVS
jgi:capsular polysaccharide biosynthesis protein